MEHENFTRNLIDEMNQEDVQCFAQGNEMTILEDEVIESRLSKLESRVKELEDALRFHTEGKKLSDPSKFITKENMAEMIQKAILQGNSEIGVSKKFIRKILHEQNEVPMSNYYLKKLNNLLAKGTKEGVICFDAAHQLYKIVH